MSRLSVSLTILMILILIPSGVDGQIPSDLDLQFMGQDGFDATDNDIDRVWIGQTTDFLVLVIQLNNVSEPGASLNFTIQTASNDIYLLGAYIHNESYTVFVSQGVNLFSQEMNSTPDTITYIDKTIYFNPNLSELGVYYYWDDIGGQDDIEVVAWSADIDGKIDRNPNVGSISYMGTSSVDRVLDLNAALNGVFEESITDSSTSLISGVQTTEFPMSTTTQVSAERNSFNGFIVVLLLIGGTIGLGIRARARNPSPAKAYPTRAKPNNASKQTPKVTNQDSVSMKFIEELGRDVRMCCYQTARLDETYCYCGRAVEDDVRNLFRN
ncbi:MAG: hypothetical protein ACXAE3_00150 [Candidatus Kariarchaeaceae archaeon]